MERNSAPKFDRNYNFDLEKTINILRTAAKPVIAVLGDYCLDKYLFIDVSQEEPSVETGLPAHQVRRKGIYPGAAGTIVNNLLALGAEVKAIGLYGNDGEGYELIRELRNRGTDISGMVCCDEMVTSTYIKPICEKGGTARELSRLDIRNSSPPSAETINRIKDHFDKIVPSCAAIIVADQFTREAGSVLSRDIPDFLARTAEKYPNKFFMADSRSNAARYRQILIKCNASEILDLVNRLDHPETEAEISADSSADENLDALLNAGNRVTLRNRRPVLVTRGAHGSILFQPDETPILIPGIPVTPPIDICGAGDATNAGLTFARALGIPLPESAFIAGVVSSITIKQIGVTGTAAPDEVIRVLAGYCKTACFG